MLTCLRTVINIGYRRSSVRSAFLVRIWLTLDITRQWQRASSGCLYDDQSPLVARGPGLLSFSCALCGNSDQWPAVSSERPPVFYSGDRDRAVTPRPPPWTLRHSWLVTVRDQVPGAGDTMWQWDEPLSQFVQEISMRTPRESCDASWKLREDFRKNRTAKYKCCLWLTRTGVTTDRESHHQINWWYDNIWPSIDISWFHWLKS